MTRCARAALGSLLLLLSLLPAPGRAGPLTVRAADGTEWRVNEDDATRLERRTADGKLDPRFGQGGVVEYTLGHSDAGTAALRVDAAGRLWVAGTSSASGTSGPVVMRFAADGKVDTAWGVGGRSSATPPGQRLVVVDLLPQPDGSVWLAGNALASPAGQHAAVWRLKPDGSLDFKFGAGGLWQRPGRERTSALGLAEAPDGSIAFGAQMATGNSVRREIYLLAADGGAPRSGETSVSDEDDEDDHYLAWGGPDWRWERGDEVAAISALAGAQASEAASAAAAGSDMQAAGQAGFSPFGVASATAPPEPPAEEQPWGLMLGGAGAVLALLGLWAWRARAERRAAGRG